MPVNPVRTCGRKAEELTSNIKPEPSYSAAAIRILKNPLQEITCLTAFIYKTTPLRRLVLVLW